jgi:hypothetical protein
MTLARRLLLVAACLLVPRVASAVNEAALFRIFLLDGSTFVSYGEFVRLEDRVIFSTPVGGVPEDPRLQVATVPASLVDWPRTDRYADSVRYQRYAATQGEADYDRLVTEVAFALNGIARSSDPQQALGQAERVRQMLADWPRTHYGYRYTDVRDIVSVLDQAISTLRASLGANPFEFSLVALTAPPDLEPVLGPPGIVEQIDQVFRLAAITTAPTERIALLQAALVMITEAGRSRLGAEADLLRQRAERQIREETTLDERYAGVSRRIMERATQAAERADGTRIERLLQDLPRADADLGNRRPALMEALEASVRQRLSDARQLRLLRDRWTLRRASYRRYQRSVDSRLRVLVKSASSLAAIRDLEGPAPERLLDLRSQLSGGAAVLERMPTPDYLRDIHERLIAAWRFAENAAQARFNAISAADAAAAWEASSSAAGALMMIARLQQDMQSLVEPPRLQ